MNYHTMTDSALAAELGARLEQLRLEQNITQQKLAEEIGITPKSYRYLIAGNGKLENFIAALRILGALEQIDNLLPPVQPSPLQQLKLQGKQRQRARQTNPNTPPKQPAPEVDW